MPPRWAFSSYTNHTAVRLELLQRLVATLSHSCARSTAQREQTEQCKTLDRIHTLCCFGGQLA